jgi:hypothetical protein
LENQAKFAEVSSYIESFNGKIWDELHSREFFYSLKDAQILIEMWRKPFRKGPEYHGGFGAL